jgi:serine/threonine-protein kinase
VTLPLVDLSPQKDQEYICDGLIDELISGLTKIDGLRVLSQSSAFQFKGKIEDVRKIGELLNVDTVLKGSVRRAGGQLRVTVQLIDVADGYYLWSETYERDIRDLFAVQKEISRAVVEALRFRLAGEQYRRLARAYTASPDAYDSYLEGRYYWNKRTEEGLRQSVEYFRQALVEDPNYALGYAALADSYALLASYGFSSPKEVMPEAKAAALRALEIDETLGEAHASLGFIRSFFDWEWSEAEREYKRALELNPGYATGHQWYSSYLRAIGQFNGALEEMKQAQRLDPLSPAIGRDFGRIYSSMRLHEQAIEQYRKTLELNPGFPSGYLHLGLAYQHVAKYEEALATLQKARAMPGGNPLILAGLGHCHARMGDKIIARQLLGELMEESKRRYVPAVDIALIHIGLGERDRAFQWLEKAYEDHDGWLAWLKVDPIFDSLRQDPRFLSLLTKVRLEAN